MRASRAIARAPEMSFCAASAAQARRKAAATMAAPNARSSRTGASSTPVMRSTTAGAAMTRQIAMRRMIAVGISQDFPPRIGCVYAQLRLRRLQQFRQAPGSACFWGSHGPPG
jgi:hypothetical protein